MIDIPNKTIMKMGKLLLFLLILTGLGLMVINGLSLFLTVLIPWFTPFILALVIALLVDPIVKYLEHRFKLSRIIATSISLLAFFAIFGMLLFLFLFHVVVEIIEFSSNLPEYFKLARLLLEDAIAQAQYLQYLYLVDLPDVMLHNIEANIDQIAKTIADISNLIINSTIYLISSLPGVLTLIVVAGVATFFLSKDMKQVGAAVLSLAPESIKPKLVEVSTKLVSALIGFMRAQLILISITALQTIAGLYILGVEYALTVGVIVGIVDILPIIGPGIVFIPWAIVLIILGNTGFALALLLLYGMIIVVRSLLEPKVVADNIGLHPLTTLLGIYVGLQAFGLIGVILGPILIIIFKAVRQTFI